MTLLDGIRVLDFTHLMAGPYCTMLLADAGADVIKVEPPWGDGSRRRGPSRRDEAGNAVSSFLTATNRGKRSVVIDLKNEGGRDAVRRMLPAVDIVIENFLPGAIARVGFDLGELRAAHPRLITASISLFGTEHARRQP
jgi:CoA:oxalate CoA-transferase